ncbi:MULTISPECIES: FAD-dependent 5-carboxymethylaminomethyl-2-thiouridine(34) oxidoreductase MnmC [unclassified Variovorax]|uniref:FAD-dependent 5-carboxymethylaminomethyl-2-thiouridine(34) oxidoreductase MnmC n=1 Tax=unclassified Variovorax TaxID=663243 RepID=UPI0008B88FCF|nr:MULTISPECIES: FAD-dependent 5-carboxymethylaminomethyl-2-thiouridine(34) oxidoreductase MnmC [unclassified Variovorax]SEJ70945.1 tRNA 5-methylaminomethyl-2-thiouridine biosynthesis bifunctional protein [Variovorax sp. OK202]SFC81130.1 tRNA 5-methylaminomethyl-2-thiouridine biosynthesis bifunctional protein [Variovorax sp. OK212]
MAAELAQARHVFLSGRGLPQAWAGQPQWLILETGFGLGLHFLTAWHAWRSDPERPRMLHYVSTEARPVSAEELLRAAQAHPGPPGQPGLASLAGKLAAQWHGLLPGFHRLAFDDGRVLLTLCIGDAQAMLRAQRFEADSLFLDDFGPREDPALWSPDALKAVSRFARQGTAIASWNTAQPVRDALRQCGFMLEERDDGLRGVFAPAWTVRRRGPAPERIDTPGRCAVIGAGLAGAAVAASLARRGWQVTVLDAADRPAAGASGLPVGMLAPHVSPDDALLSRLTRAGIRATWSELVRLLEEGRDWRASGVLERRPDGDTRVPAGWSVDGPNESWPANAEQLAAVGLPGDTPALWHARAAWVKPHQLIAAWLRQPGVEFRGGCHVARLEPHAGGWQLFDAEGEWLADADRVVVCAGFESGRFAPALPLQPVRGQVAWGPVPDHTALPTLTTLPTTPINGDGHLVAQVPVPHGPPIWLAGATFDRDSTTLEPTEADSLANRDRLARLHPAAAAALAGTFERGEVHAWVGVRCASGDRRPLVGPIGPLGPLGPIGAIGAPAAGLWACTALGSRGLSFAALCAELLAAQWHAEPLPLPATLAKALGTQRI